MTDHQDKLCAAEVLWEEVYSLVSGSWADIEAGRPTFEEDEAKTPEQFQADDRLRSEQEISILRECVHEIVRTALVMLGGWSMHSDVAKCLHFADTYAERHSCCGKEGEELGADYDSSELACDCGCHFAPDCEDDVAEEMYERGLHV